MDYFETPARAERLQLLQHLLRNAGEVIYLRAPAGAGKTRFAHRLLEMLGDDMATVWVRGGRDLNLPALAADQLGLAAEDVERWPDALLDAVGDQELLVVVDDADRLDLSAVESLALLHEAGARLLLLGHGGLAQIKGDWDVQFVDLPAFDVGQSIAFLRGRAGADAARVTQDLGAALHHGAHGLPGPMLDALDDVLARARRKQASKTTAPVPEARPSQPGRPLWHWLGAGALVLLLVAALVFQDRINALFQAPRSASPPQVAEAPQTDGQIARDLAALPDGPVEAAGPASPVAEPAAPVVTGVAEPEIPPPPVTADPPPLPAAAVAEVPPAPSTADGEQPPDPLDAVMRDAFRAAAANTDVVSATPAAVEPAPTPPAVIPQRPEAAAQPVQAPSPEPVQQPPREVSGRVAAPVEERQAAAPPASPKRAPAAGPDAPVVVPQPVEVVSRTAPDGGQAWLESRKAGHYTLQLVGARDRAGIQKFVAQHGIKQPYAIFERQLDGRPWFSLVAGDYADRTAALAARAQLPAGLERSGVWPRTFGSIPKKK